MTIRIYRPSTPGSRNKVISDFSEITKIKPNKSLTNKFYRAKGRNNQGKITIRHRGGGHKRLYRMIDFKRNKYNILGLVTTIEYDPNRSARIALITYKDGEKRYILHPESLKIGDEILAGENIPVKIGNSLPLKNIPVGSEIHNIELHTHKGAQIVRSAGMSARLLNNDNNYATIRLPSKEIRLVNNNCYATIGKISNNDHSNITLGKAGRKRWLGIRPTVRGSVMNPVDHPHGGGEGRCPIGRSRPLTPWSKPALGVKTRRKNKYSDIFIIRPRK